MIKPEDQKTIDKILEMKSKLVAESEVLQANKRATKQWGYGNKERYSEIVISLGDLNRQLTKLGYRISPIEINESKSLLVLLRMKDIITENFGREKANAFEQEATRRSIDNEESDIFPLLSDAEHRILESHKQWERDKLRYEAIKRQMIDIKTFIQKRISVECDYEKRKLYTEIFKML
jgi:hypothetical protein